MCATMYSWHHLVKSMEITAGMADSNGSLPLQGRLNVTCGLTACTLELALAPPLGNEYGRTYLFTARRLAKRGICRRRVSVCLSHTPVWYQNG